MNLKALGPGILMATAAIGGSHLVASTQAGALFGWQLAWLIVLVNVLKYPFFRFAVQYTCTTGEDLISGYKRQGKGYFYCFILLNVIAAIVNAAGVLLLSAALLHYILGGVLGLGWLSAIILVACLGVLLLGRYRALDTAAKVIMLLLVISTLSACGIAFVQSGGAPMAASADFNAPDVLSLSAIGFLVVLMGWMPAPIEISAINSLWLKAKQEELSISKKAALFDFNLGYWLTTGLALVFFALGVMVQFGASEHIELAGVAFAKQLIDMYALTIGEWSRWLIATVAFLCMLGTSLTVLDGYTRTLNESAKLLIQRPNPKGHYSMWLALQSVCAMVVILFFKSNLKDMLTFAMTLAFLTTPVFAWLNMRLVNKAGITHSVGMKVLTWVGLVYLIGFSVGFVIWQGLS